MRTEYRLCWQPYTTEQALHDLSVWTDTHLVYCACEEYSMGGSADTLKPHPQLWVRDNKDFLTKRNNRLTIVTGSHEHNRETQQAVRYLTQLPGCEEIMWPTFWLEQFNTQQNRSVFMHNNQEFEYLFSCMMHRPHPHRATLMEKLMPSGLIENNLVTWHGSDAGTTYDYHDNFPRIDLQGHGGIQGTEIILYDRALIDLVVETTDTQVFWTEKTQRALLLGKPFIILGSPGVNQALTEYGYELYDELFDYGEDDNPDIEDRIYSIIRQLQDLSKRDLSELYQLVQPKIQRNYQRLIENSQSQPERPEILRTPEGRALYPYFTLIENSHTDIDELLRGS